MKWAETYRLYSAHVLKRIFFPALFSFFLFIKSVFFPAVTFVLILFNLWFIQRLNLAEYLSFETRYELLFVFNSNCLFHVIFTFFRIILFRPRSSSLMAAVTACAHVHLLPPASLHCLCLFFLFLHVAFPCYWDWWDELSARRREAEKSANHQPPYVSRPLSFSRFITLPLCFFILLAVLIYFSTFCHLITPAPASHSHFQTHRLELTKSLQKWK